MGPSYCPYCGEETRDGASYCSSCGEKLALDASTEDDAASDPATGSGPSGATSGETAESGLSRRKATIGMVSVGALGLGVGWVATQGAIDGTLLPIGGSSATPTPRPERSSTSATGSPPPADDEDGQATTATTTRISFEQADLGAPKPADPWYIAANNGHHEITGSNPTDEEQTLHLSGDGSIEELAAGLPVDLTNVAEVVCDIYIERVNPSVGDLALHIDKLKDNKTIPFGGRVDFETGQYVDMAGDVSEYTGTHDLYLRARGENEGYFDNLRFYDDDRELVSLDEVLPDTATETPHETASGTVLLDDFEDTSGLDWTIENGDRSRLEFSRTAPRGDYSLHFVHDSEDKSTKISREIGPTRMAGFSLWFRYESSNDNNFRVILESSSGDKVLEFREFFGRMHYRDPEKRGQAVEQTGIASVSQNEWYRLAVENMSYSDGTVDAAVFDEAGNRIDGVTGIGFWEPAEDISTVRIVDGLGNNGNPDPLWIDHVRYRT